MIDQQQRGDAFEWLIRLTFDALSKQDAVAFSQALTVMAQGMRRASELVDTPSITGGPSGEQYAFAASFVESWVAAHPVKTQHAAHSGLH